MDSASTRNFIDINVAKRLNLFVCPTKDLSDMVAKDKEIIMIGRCHKVSLQIQSFELPTGYMHYHSMEYAFF